MKATGFEDRLFKYHTYGHRCSLLFCSYQIMNFIGSYLHNEEWIHIIHHIASVITSWMMMHPGNAHFYVIAGSATEIPAFLSSVYISFDHGGLKGFVPGLGIAFPRVRVILCFLTGISFIFCRVFFFFFIAMHYLRDISRAMDCKKKSCQAWKPYLPIYKYCVSIILAIQFYLFLCLLGYIPIILGTTHRL